MERTYQYCEFKRPFSCQVMTSNKAGNPDFHMHNNFELYLLLDGHVSYFVEQSCYTMAPGNLILFTNQEIHKATNLTGEPFTRMVLHVNPDYLRQYCSDRTNLLGCFLRRRPGEGNLLPLTSDQLAQYQSLFFKIQGALSDPSYGSDLLAMTSLIELLVLVNRCWIEAPSRTHGQGQPMHRVQPIMTYIDAHLTEPLSLDSIAKGLSIDKFYLSHIFREATESTIFQYILIKRIALAKHYLAMGKSVTEACHLSGFNDYCNFIRSFKNVTGSTPGAYRKKMEG